MNPPPVPLLLSRGIEVTQVIAVTDSEHSSAAVSTQQPPLKTTVPLETPVSVSTALPVPIPVSSQLQDLVLQDQSGNVIKILKIYSPMPTAVEDKKKGEKEVDKLLGASEIDTLTASIASIASRDELFEVQVGPSQQEAQSTIAPGLFEFSQAVECSLRKDQVVEEDFIEENPNEEVVVTDSVPEVEKEIIFNQEKNQFQCQRCLKTYKYKSGVINHLLNQCSGSDGPKLFACDFCAYTAQMPVTLRVHLARNHKVTGINLNRSNISKNFGMVAGELKFPKAKSVPKRSTLNTHVTVKEETNDGTDDLASDPDFKMPVSKKKSKPKLSGSTTPSRPKRAKQSSSKILDEEFEETTPRDLKSFTQHPSTSAHENVEEGTSSGRETPDEPHENEFDFNEETGKYKCKTCKKIYKVKNHMEDHKYFDCRKKNIHQCLFCPYKGRTPTNVRVHIGHKHGKWPRLDENGVWIY